MKWMWKLITQELISNLKDDQNIMTMIHEFEERVENGIVTSGEASETILNAFYDRGRK